MFAARFDITVINLSQRPPGSTRLPRWPSGKQKHINRRRQGDTIVPKFRDCCEMYNWFEDRKARLEWNAYEEMCMQREVSEIQEAFQDEREEERVARATRDAKRNSVE